MRAGWRALAYRRDDRARQLALLAPHAPVPPSCCRRRRCRCRSATACLHATARATYLRISPRVREREREREKERERVHTHTWGPLSKLPTLLCFLPYGNRTCGLSLFFFLRLFSISNFLSSLCLVQRFVLRSLTRVVLQEREREKLADGNRRNVRPEGTTAFTQRIAAWIAK